MSEMFPESWLPYLLKLTISRIKLKNLVFVSILTRCLVLCFVCVRASSVCLFSRVYFVYGLWTGDQACKLIKELNELKRKLW